MLKKEVLREKGDFSRLYNKGKSAGGKYLVLFYIKNEYGYTRRAFLASKKVGNSVKRNRARRLIRESFRSMETEIATGYDILFIARNTIEGMHFQDVEKSMKTLLAKSGLLI